MSLAQPDDSPSPQLYLREYRERAGFTLKELADRLEIHFTVIQKWETCVSWPKIPHLLKLANIYKVHLAALFFHPSNKDLMKIDKLITFAELVRVSPIALGLAGEEPEQRQRAEQLTRCLTILNQKSDAWSEYWLKLGEVSPSRDKE